MKKLNKNELLDVYKKAYTWGHEWSDSDIKYYTKKARQDMAFKFQDDNVLIFEYPSIDSTMAYDDEYDAPSKSFESWRNYNLRNLSSKSNGVEKWLELHESLKKYGYCGGGYGRMWLIQCNKNNKDLVSLQYKDADCYFDNWPDEKHLFVRYLTDEEQEEVVNAYKEWVNAYEKRLKTYYKRYADKITTLGYWANR